MNKQYWLIIITYALMQLSGIIGINLLLVLGVGSNQPSEYAIQEASGYWTLISFTLALLIVLFLLRKEIGMRHNAEVFKMIQWSFLGVLLALAAQSLAALVENRLFGIEPGSENTKFLLDLMKITPLLFVAITVIGPILEEIVFRKIIFGSLAPNIGFFLSAIISSLVFGALHMDFSHILIYTSMGLVFAYLYVKTRQIMVPIMAHVLMNSLVVLSQTVFA